MNGASRWSIQSNVKGVSFSTNHWLVCIPSECQIANQCILETWSIRSICASIYCELGFVPISRISPVCSLGSVFAKIGGDGATGLLIDPTQSYFGSLLRIMVDQPLYFKATRTTLTTAAVGELTYPLRVTLLVQYVALFPGHPYFRTLRLDDSVFRCKNETNPNDTFRRLID